MLTDALLQVSNAQAVTNAAVVSTNTIDLTQARDIGEGKVLYMVFRPVETFTGGTSLNCEVITADNAALTSNVVVLGATGATPTAQLTVPLVVAIAPNIATTGKQYLGARYTPVGTFTAGKMTADIVETVQDGQKFYKSGFTV